MATKTSSLNVLITGCSAGGIGSTLALALASRGHHVFATLRTRSKISPELASNAKVTVLELDVTLDASIRAAVEAVAQSTGGKGLDILVNNAGMGYAMPLLDVDVERGRQVFEANVWGVLAVTKGFFDLLVEARGVVVNVSSVGGEVNTPWIGVYSASKAALTIMSETLRLEVAAFGVRVQTIMVGAISTPFGDKAVFELPPTSRYQAVKETITKWATFQAGPKRENVDAFVERIVDDVVRGRSGQIWRGAQSSATSFSARYLPKSVLDYFMSQDQGLDKLSKSV